MKYLFSSYVFSHSYIYTTSLWIVCTVSRMSIVRRIYFMFSSICSTHSQFWKYFMFSLLLECTTCLCTCIDKWCIIAIMCIYVTYVGQTLTTNPVKNVKNIFHLHDSNAKMYIIFDSVLEFSKTVNKIEHYELYFVPIGCWKIWVCVILEQLTY